MLVVAAVCYEAADLCKIVGDFVRIIVLESHHGRLEILEAQEPPESVGVV